MRPLWVPLSAVMLPGDLSFAPPLLLRRLLSQPRTLTYAGDRMFPVISHGQGIECVPLESDPVAGDVVLACPGGIPDLLRIESFSDGRYLLGGDADPAPPVRVDRGEILAGTHLPRRRPGHWRRVLRRLQLDLREALHVEPPVSSDPARTVLHKYDTQAPFYAGQATTVAPELLGMVRQHTRASGRAVVAGSGTGVECFALARDGWEVLGLDFSPAMVNIARLLAGTEGSLVDFQVADLRHHEEPAGCADLILFTYDVYSFLPDADDRVALLRKMRGWLRPGGVILLSARRLRGIRARGMLTLEYLATRPSGWGGSHTRWISPDGAIERSFVQFFSERRLRREIDRAGLAAGPWEGGHRPLFPRI